MAPCKDGTEFTQHLPSTDRVLKRKNTDPKVPVLPVVRQADLGTACLSQATLAPGHAKAEHDPTLQHLDKHVHQT